MVILVASFVGDWVIGHSLPGYVPDYPRTLDLGFFKDVASYLIAGQIGVLAIVSVAVGVVTLLSDRDDGSSINTDIRLYYVESYSYELATSGVALLLVLTLQLFWPFHHLLHSFLIDTHGNWSKLVMSIVHAVWFCINLLLFLQFITTTLRFVEPNTREELRERYSANEVIPRDVRTRLIRALYANLVGQMFGEAALRDAPGIIVGRGSGLDSDLFAEVTIAFQRPSKLIDVRVRPLKWALSRWRERAQKRAGRRSRNNALFWEDMLALTPNTDQVLDGQVALVERRGPVALTHIEKWIIRWSFRFSQKHSRLEDLPTPDDFLQQLVNKVVRQIEQGATTGFQAALREVVRYHAFILEAQNTKGKTGGVFNFAEVGGYWSRPDADWVRQYRQAFTSAANKVGDDTYFMNALSELGSRLVPDDGLNFSRPVLEDLLELGVFEVIALQDWVTRHAVIREVDEVGRSANLAGSDRRAYETALIGFVGGWENFLQTYIASFSIRRRSMPEDVDAHWQAFAKSFSVYQAHLHRAAYFLTTAVWNDDGLGSDRFRDLLLRWLNPFYDHLQNPYVIRNSLLLTPDAVARPWQDVRTNLVGQLSYGHEMVQPSPVFGTLLWEVHCDVVCVSGLVALYWYATDKCPSKAARDAAVLTIKRCKRESDGAVLTVTTQKTDFRLLFDFAVRYAINPRFASEGYSAVIGGLISFLMDVSSSPMISGRVYGGAYADGFDTIRPVLLAAMAACLPTSGDDGALAVSVSLAHIAHRGATCWDRPS